MPLLKTLAAAGISLVATASLCGGKDVDWPTYGGDKAGTRYSRLTQINTHNVRKLRVAWQYDTGEGRGDAQTQPIVIDGVLYGITPKHRIIALDAATGRLLWQFDSGLEGRGPDRGLTYWSDGSERRIFVGIQSFLYALDPATGRPIASFGKAGRIDLREGLGRDPASVSIILTTPGIVYKDLIIVGGRMPEVLPSAPGDIRAFSVRTGELRWSFHTIPRPGDEGYESWPKDAWTYTGSANNWCGMALDERAGVLFAPTGSAASDFYGYDRLGDDLFANTLLALDAASGKRIWHFQAVHHDIWDRDFPSPPTLLSVRLGGSTIPAVAQTTKQGTVYLFDRTNGQPLFPVDSRAFPQSNVEGEKAARDQPLPTKPAPFARQSLTADMLTTRTPEAHEWALQRFQTMRSQGQFVPPSVDKETVVFPGYDGGAEWGGSALDPTTRILYVNSNDVAWTAALAANTGDNSGKQLYLRNCAVCHGDSRAGAPPQIPSLIEIGRRRTEAEITSIVRQGAGRMPGFPTLKEQEISALLDFLVKGEDKELSSGGSTARVARYRFTGYKKFLDPDGYPAIAPPWGTLNAINLNTGEYVWRLPLGEYPELSKRGRKNTGTENYGGPVVTRGGLVFIAATNFDNKVRAFDKRNGKLLWDANLPASGNATPATYQVNGRQFLVVYATGGKAAPSSTAGGLYVAFALPEK
ncbi:MAG: PQQ-binding-like beta-propeller repeat protein [Bryobacteraceae bacterium]